MRQSERYAVFSLELHLFFARIMKEHALFLMAGFTPASAAFIREADTYRQRFEALLAKTVQLADGVARQEVLGSGEVVTPFTLQAEEQTQRFTGISIDRKLTEREEKLRPSGSMGWRPAPIEQVGAINRTALSLLDGLISLKERVLAQVLSCRMFTANYPLMLEHIIHEAKLYRDCVARLETDGDLDPQAMGGIEDFWNHIMLEHALFMRGLLDPTEGDLIESANNFAGDYALLLEESGPTQDAALAENSLEETERFRDFKTAGVKGIEACEIRSIILPLLADHVLREANHYIRLLNA